MAKVFGPHQSPRAPSFRGAFVIRPGRSGQVAQAWPQPRKRRLSPKQQEAVEKFREAAWIAKAAPAEDQMTSRKLAHGSQFLPRDLQYMAIYGRLCTLFFTNGERRYQLASRFDLTELLDILGFAPGSMLVRGEEFWEVLPPATEPSLLANLGTGPRWLTPGEAGAGGGGFGTAISVHTGTTDSNDGVTKGIAVIPRSNVLINAIWGPTSNVTGEGTRRGGLVPITAIGSGAQLEDDAIVTPWVTNSGDYQDAQRYAFDEPVQLLAGQPYLAFMTVNKSPATQPIRLNYVNTASAAWLQSGPFLSPNGAYRFSLIDMIQGAVVDSYAGQIYTLWLEGNPN